MNRIVKTLRNGATLVLANLVLANTGVAAQPGDAPRSKAMRSEVWLAVTSWPALGELSPVVDGSFDPVGYGLGGALYWPLKSMPAGDLSIGIEGAIMATESNIPVLLDELMARDGYIAASLKWTPARARTLTLDAGLAYHLLDITQLETDYNILAEFESWEESALGPHLGVTWNPGAGEAGRSKGMTLGLRAHFLDFGTVRDEEVLGSAVLGRDAGDLAGTLLVLQLGYRWR